MRLVASAAAPTGHLCLQRPNASRLCQTPRIHTFSHAHRCRTRLQCTAVAKQASKPASKPLPHSLQDFIRLSATIPPALFSACAFLLAAPAFAEDMEGVAYDPTAGSAFFTTVAGVLYVLLVVYFLFRLLQRRAKRATTERVASNDDSDDEEEPVPPPQDQKVPVWRSAVGMLQVGAFTVLAYTLATKLEGYALGIDLPTNYTARNLTSALRTIVVAAAYLATFLLAANTVGLAGLTLKIALFGDDDGEAKPVKKDDPLPKVRITDDLETVRAAFDAIELKAKRKAEAVQREKEEAAKKS